MYQGFFNILTNLVITLIRGLNGASALRSSQVITFTWNRKKDFLENWK